MGIFNKAMGYAQDLIANPTVMATSSAVQGRLIKQGVISGALNKKDMFTAMKAAGSPGARKDLMNQYTMAGLRAANKRVQTNAMYGGAIGAVAGGVNGYRNDSGVFRGAIKGAGYGMMGANVGTWGKVLGRAPFKVAGRGIGGGMMTRAKNRFSGMFDEAEEMMR